MHKKILILLGLTIVLAGCAKKETGSEIVIEQKPMVKTEQTVENTENKNEITAENILQTVPENYTFTTKVNGATIRKEVLGDVFKITLMYNEDKIECLYKNNKTYITDGSNLISSNGEIVPKIFVENLNYNKGDITNLSKKSTYKRNGQDYDIYSVKMGGVDYNFYINKKTLKSDYIRYGNIELEIRETEKIDEFSTFNFEDMTSSQLLVRFDEIYKDVMTKEFVDIHKIVNENELQSRTNDNQTIYTGNGYTIKLTKCSSEEEAVTYYREIKMQYSDYKFDEDSEKYSSTGNNNDGKRVSVFVKNNNVAEVEAEDIFTYMKAIEIAEKISK